MYIKVLKRLLPPFAKTLSCHAALTRVFRRFEAEVCMLSLKWSDQIDFHHLTHMHALLYPTLGWRCSGAFSYRCAYRRLEQGFARGVTSPCATPSGQQWQGVRLSLLRNRLWIYHTRTFWFRIVTQLASMCKQTTVPYDIYWYIFELYVSPLFDKVLTFRRLK